MSGWLDLSRDRHPSGGGAAFLSGKYDLGWKFPGTINRTDWIQIKDTLKQRRPNRRTAESPANVETHISMRADAPPFKDPRVRQAISLAVDRQGMIDATFEGRGIFNPAVPAALKDWALPISELGDGARYFRHDPAEAKRLLAAARDSKTTFRYRPASISPCGTVL